ncbi:MAG: PIN domain-containing protein [Chloroflexi bacterium]|nr:PIN domain-containing protein [Chloroflexota bacterium]
MPVARPEVPDTSAILDSVRHPDRWPALERALHTGRVWLCSVVVAELYAGTRSAGDAALVDHIVDAMRRIERLLTPTGGDWARAGRLLVRRARLHGDLRARDHLADALILVSAAAVRGTVVTANLRHFLVWQRLAAAAGLDVLVRSVEISEG